MRLTAVLIAALVVLVAPVPANAATQIVVKFKKDASARSADQALRGTQTVGRVTRLGAVVVRVPVGGSALVRNLRRSGLVEYAELDRTLRVGAIPDDPRFPEQYALRNTGQAGGTAGADVAAPAGWDAFGLGAFPTALDGAKVGIVDTGIRATHEDLVGRAVDCAATKPALLGLLFGDPTPLESRGCADDNGHGTHVAGTVAAAAGNGRGIAGLAFTSPLAICKALHGAAGSGPTSGVANCITYLTDRGAKVISLSLGGGRSETLERAVRYAVDRDAVVVAAAGNAGSTSLSYPASYPEVVSVGATDRKDARASFSNRNDEVEVSAPGVDILSTWNASDSSYRLLSGTSMATPHVAAVAALIRPRAGSGPATRSRLRTAVDDLGAPGRDPEFGFGRVDLVKAGG
jgi:thermitase